MIKWRSCSKSMLKNYLVTAFRNIVKHKSYSFINILGFALGISCFLLITIYIRDELSYDDYHSRADSIYRVSEIYTQSGTLQHIANSSAPWGPGLKDEFPEVLEYVRFKPPVTQYVVSRPDRDLQFYEKRFVFADASVFSVFDFQLLEGEPDDVLQRPNTVVLTRSAALKYFGNEDPTGKTLIVDGNFPFVVTGIMEDVLYNSHFKFDFLASFITLENPGMRAYAGPITFWLDRRSNFFTYILLAKGASAEALERKLPDFMEKYSGELRRRMGTLNTLMPTLQHLPDIHLTSHLEREWEPNGDIRNVYILFSISLFVLLIACFNFMNLSTARSAMRAQEVALRKLVGAERIRLVRQFLVESVFLTFLATVLALGIAHLFLPMINAISGKELSIGYISDPWVIPGIVLLVIFVGLLSGFYPALVLSAFRPGAVFKSTLGSGSGGKVMRQILITFQFAVSVILLIGLGVVTRQMSLFHSQDLGYDKNNVVVIPLSNAALRTNYQTYKDTILTHSQVLFASGSNTVMGKAPVTREARPSDAGDESNMSYELIEADQDFLRTYRIELAAGRDFSIEMGDETAGAVIINQEAVRGLGLSDPVAANISKIKPVQPKKVIGVAKDFHMESLHVSIRPVIISLGQFEPYQYLSVRIAPGDIPGTLDFLQDRWAEIYTGTPFAYTFFDQDLDALYRSEQRLGQLFFYFTSLALIIACMGMVGLVSFIAERRSKEIGMRKILGASVLHIALILLKEFAILVVIANLIAWPLAYFAMNGWLQDFAYRTSIGLELFAAAAVLVLAAAFISVSFQTFRASTADPIHALRYE